jgi:hypothetical protein
MGPEEYLKEFTPYEGDGRDFGGMGENISVFQLSRRSTISTTW